MAEMYIYRKLTPEQRQQLVEERKRRRYPLHQPPHPVRDQPLYLLTAACYEHQPVLDPPERRDKFEENIHMLARERGFEVWAWVILPNHYHLIAHTPDFELFGTFFKLLHGRTAFDWNREDETRGRKVWYRYNDRAIRSEGHLYAAFNYIHYNPVKHGLVASPYDWPWSSLLVYLEGNGREWLRDKWQSYPIGDFGSGWDDNH